MTFNGGDAKAQEKGFRIWVLAWRSWILVTTDLATAVRMSTNI